MNNSIYELVNSHISIFDTNLQNVKLPLGTDKFVNGIMQLDFLAFYPDKDRLQLYGCPSNKFDIRDNPNRGPTEYENVYEKLECRGENIMYDLQLIVPGKSPIAILNRYYFKVREGNKYVYKWRISIYGKALKLYYMGYIPRLMDYIIKYNGVCCRADLCWDFPCKIPNGIVDLNITGTNHTTTYFGEKNSPFMVRIYDKTQDLKHQKNCFAWLYENRYLKECRRLECQFKGDYAKSMNPLDWLDICKVDKSKIQKQEKINRNVYKTALYSVIDTIDWLNLSSQEKLAILINSKNLIEKKIKKMSKDVF